MGILDYLDLTSTEKNNIEVKQEVTESVMKEIDIELQDMIANILENSMGGQPEDVASKIIQSIGLTYDIIPKSNIGSSDQTHLANEYR